MKNQHKQFLSILALSSFGITQAQAVEIEPTAKAVSELLGTTKAFKKTAKVDGKDVSYFYSKDDAGKTKSAVFIEHGLWEPNCTHTWAIGFDATTKKVTGIKPLEMACPHAYPTKAEGYLAQYMGKGPADVSTLDSDIVVIAKATGSCKLLTAAVKRSITAIDKVDAK